MFIHIILFYICILLYKILFNSPLKINLIIQLPIEHICSYNKINNIDS